MSEHHSDQPDLAAETVKLEYQREFRRLLVTGIILAVLILALGVLIIYGLGETPGMARDALGGPTLN